MKKPCILITRPQHQGNSLIEALSKEDYKTIDLPLLEILPATVDDDIIQTLHQLDDYNLIIALSINAVEIFFDTLKSSAPKNYSCPGNKIPETFSKWFSLARSCNFLSNLASKDSKEILK